MEPSREYVKKHLVLADEFLDDAKTFLRDGRLRSAADRAYYSMYYSAHALLIDRKIRPPKTHSGLVALFSREIIKRALMDREFGKILARAFSLRQKSTYRVTADIEVEAVRELVEDAEKFVNKAKELVNLDL